MYNKEEERLIEYKKMVDDLPVSLDSLDDAILAGFYKAKAEERKKPRKKRWMYSLAIAAILLIGFFTSIRFSPVFADYITVVPGMEKIVDMIRHDKGRMSAVEHQYYQEIGVTQKKNGLEMKIDGAVADEKGMVLFYSMKSDKKIDEPSVDGADLKSMEGENLDRRGTSYGAMNESQKEKKRYGGQIEYYFEKPIHSKKYELKLKVSGSHHVNEQFNLKFTLPKELKTKKTFTLNKTMNIEGQKIMIKKAEIYPLRVEVHVKADPNNTKRLMDFDDFRLVDEKGESWGGITSGVTGSKDANEEVIYLQSNYFHKPQKLYLVLNKVQAIDKSNDKLIIDTKRNKIIKQPKGNLFSDLKVKKNSLSVMLNTKKRFPFMPFSTARDGKGKEIEYSESFATDHEKGPKEKGIVIKNVKNYKNPISIELSYFPEWIHGEQKIRIK